MECRRTEERLSDHLEGTLDPLLDGELRAHLDGCDVCRDLRSAMAEVIDALREAPGEPSSDLAVRAAEAALRAHRRRPRRVGLPTFVGLPPWVLATAAVLALALSTGLVTASGNASALPGTRLAQKVSAAGIYIAEHKDRLVEDFRVLRVLVGTAFEGRVDVVNDRVEDYRRMLERRQKDEQAARGNHAETAPAPAERSEPPAEKGRK